LNVSLGNRIWHAPLAASVLGGLLVLLFDVLSCVVLMRWAREPCNAVK
jgi:hypothetical protein